MAITITLTREQLDFLREILLDAKDEGPYDEPWASDELKELRLLFNKVDDDCP